MFVGVVYVSDLSNILRSVDVADVSDILSDCCWTGTLTGWQKHSSPFHDTEVTGCVYVSEPFTTLRLVDVAHVSV